MANNKVSPRRIQETPFTSGERVQRELCVRGLWMVGTVQRRCFVWARINLKVFAKAVYDCILLPKQKFRNIYLILILTPFSWSTLRKSFWEIRYRTDTIPWSDGGGLPIPKKSFWRVMEGWERRHRDITRELLYWSLPKRMKTTQMSWTMCGHVCDSVFWRAFCWCARRERGKSRLPAPISTISFNLLEQWGVRKLQGNHSASPGVCV